MVQKLKVTSDHLSYINQTMKDQKLPSTTQALHAIIAQHKASKDKIKG